MAYTRNWDESQPQDHTKLSDVPSWMRVIKTDVAQRLKDWIYGFISGETKIGLKKAPLYPVSSDPATESDKGILYVKEVDGVKELFYKDSGGNVKQITKKGDLNFVAFESGDILLTTKTTTPEGWEDLSATYDNRFIRISSGTPLETGGSDTHNHGGETEGHALTIDEMPAHSHSYLKFRYGGGGTSGSDYPHDSSWEQTSSVGGGQPHSHGIAEASNVPAYIQVRMLRKL